MSSGAGVLGCRRASKGNPRKQAVLHLLGAVCGFNPANDGKSLFHLLD
jgi:hypothetical protein